MASSVATSCKASHSSGLSTGIRGIEVFFVSGDEMIGGYRRSTDELNIVFEVGAFRDACLVEDRLTQRDQVKPLQNCLSSGAGGRLVHDSPPEEIYQWQSERGCSALDLLRPARQVENAETFRPTAPLRHYVNENIDVDENLQSVILRAMISRIRVLSSSTGFAGWIPTKASRSGSIGTLGHCFNSNSRSVSPCRVSASSRSFCSRRESSWRSRARKVDISSSRTSLSNSSTCSGVFSMMDQIIDGGVTKDQVELGISLKADKQIGVTVSQSVPFRADKVIR